MKKPFIIKNHIIMSAAFPWILRRAHLKVTPGRLAVMGFFGKHSEPASAEQIFAVLKSKSNIDQTTVYRTVASFEKAGIIKRIDLRTGAVLYEMQRRHHHHLVCVKCGLVEDVEMCGIEDASKKILKQSKKFGSIKEHSLELFGLCKACEKR
jgi:Fe2+ or Zn2+ uptake regulation protein